MRVICFFLIIFFALYGAKVLLQAAFYALVDYFGKTRFSENGSANENKSTGTKPF
jgi:hypothetical protein